LANRERQRSYVVEFFNSSLKNKPMIITLSL
jgi:hypothetical protein